MSDCNLPPQLSSWKCQADLTPDVVLLLTTRCLLGVHLSQICLMVICLLNLVIEQKMYVDWSLCSCCCFSCVILLLLQQQEQQQQQDWFIDHWTEMYVNWSCCSSCCCFSCVILLLLQQQNYTLTTKTTTTTKKFSYW